MADPDAAFPHRQREREAERAQLAAEEDALILDIGNLAEEEYARREKKLQERREELDRQEREWKKVMNPRDFRPDADPRRTQDRENRDAVREVRERMNPTPEPEYGRGKAEKFYGKTPVPYKGAEKEAAAEMDAAMATSSEEGSGEESEDEEESEEEEAASPTLDDRRMAVFDESESESEESVGTGDPAERKRDRRQAAKLYVRDRSGESVDDAEKEERDEYLNAYEALVVTQQMQNTQALLAKLKQSVEFYVRQADRVVRNAEACKKATQAVMDALEDRDASENDCKAVLDRVKEQAKTLQSTVTKALNDAYSSEELAAYVEEDHVYVEQQMEENEEPYARAQELSAQKKLTMFQAVEKLMASYEVRFDVKKCVEEEGEDR